MSDPKDINRIPVPMLEGLLRYVNHHIRPGRFLMAIITNNLAEACYRADDVNVHIIPAYVDWFFNYAPFDCWGSEEKMNAWLAKEESE